jgi:hypothetical protein
LRVHSPDAVPPRPSSSWKELKSRNLPSLTYWDWLVSARWRRPWYVCQRVRTLVVWNWRPSGTQCRGK